MFSFQIPVIKTGQFSLNVEIGQTIFVLGPNGSGKSGLLHYLHAQADSKVKWIQAHRRTWLSSDSPAMTPAQLQQAVPGYIGNLHQPYSRYSQLYSDDFYGNEAIMTLIHRQNADARATHDAVRNGDSREIARRRNTKDVVEELNSILRQSNIGLTIKIGLSDNLIATRGRASYGVNQMSDGERNAFLLICNVLTAPAGTLFFIDEPETHLHHSIASPLLSRLFALRTDCSFLVAVHQISLPMDNSEASILLLRDCAFENGIATKWDLDFIESARSIPEDIRATILGARKTVVFVEGTSSSLDYPLYASVLPGVSVIPVGSYRSVKSAVKSIDAIPGYHHIRCFGIIDRDHRRSDELDTLRAKGVFAVDGYSVESIYYSERMQRMVVEHIAKGDADQLLADAKRRALDALAKSETAICEVAVRARIRYTASDEVDKADLEHADDVRIPVRSEWNRETKAFRDALGRGNLDSLIRQYIPKKSGALHQIASALGFNSRKAYERVVITLLQEDETALRHVGERFADLLTAIEHID